MCRVADRSGQISGKVLSCFVALALAVAGAGVKSQCVGDTVKTPQGQRTTASGPATTLADQAAAAKAQGQFAIDLYQQLAKSEAGKNVFLSPFSVSTALTIAAEGAVDQTRDQMLDVLHITSDNLEQIHRGQRGLQSTVAPAIPPKLAKQLAALRAELKAAHKRTTELGRANQPEEARQSFYAEGRLIQQLRKLAGYDLRFSNALWQEQSYPIEPNFVSTMKPYYGAVLFPVDFRQHPEAARQQINQWVAQQTEDRIPNLLGPGAVTDQLRLLVTNTVYFNGYWAQLFDPQKTFTAPFQSNGRSSPVRMMRQENEKAARYAAFTGAGKFFPTPKEVRIDIKDDDPSLYPDAKGHVLASLDYQGGQMQMIFILPQSPTGLAELERTLSYDNLQSWISQLDRRVVNVFIPKISLKSKYELKDSLQPLGMTRCFTSPGGQNAGAQFDKLTSTSNPADRLFISDVVHQAYLDVGEFGTEATAVTAVSLSVASGELGPDDTVKTRPFIPIFRANRPFLFLIRDRETSSILFLGRFISPGSVASGDAG